MMISVGTDILEIERMERLQKKGRIDRIFTEEERRQSEGRTSRLAGDFSVKEAVAKTFGTGVRGFSLLEIEVLRDALGKPFVKLYGNARKVFDSLKGQSIEVSISNTGKLVIATAILVKKRNRDRAEISLLPLPKRNPASHKGSYGKVAIFAGKKGMAGAAFFSALGAYRAGAGLVYLYTEKENRTALQTLIPEAIQEDLEDTGQEIADKTVLLLGPGWGKDEEKKNILLDFLQRKESRAARYLVLDADALNLIAESETLETALIQYALQFPVILTPHLMEFSRLCHCSLQELTEKREELGEKYAREHHCVLILKSHDTMVFAPSDEGQGRHFFHNEESCPALSKGGSGDVFAGFLSGLLCVLQEKYGDRPPKEIAFQSACHAVRIQVEGGKRAAEREGEHAVLARELPHYFALAMEENIEKEEER